MGFQNFYAYLCIWESCVIIPLQLSNSYLTLLPVREKGSEMTLQQQYPIGSKVLNLTKTYGEVVGYRNDELILEGRWACQGIGRWVADPEKCTLLCKDSMGISGKFEYFSFNGQLYRALSSNPMDCNGYRNGGRWQTRMSFVDGKYIEKYGLLGF